VSITDAPTNRYDFALFYEHWQRELFGLQLLHAELRRRGYSVVVKKVAGERDKQLRAVDPIDFAADVVVYPWVYGTREVSQALAPFPGTTKLVNLQAEQIYSDYSAATGWNRIKEEALSAFHVAWGPESERKYRAWGVPEDRIWSCGSLHLDLADPAFDQALFTRDQIAEMYDLRPDREWSVFFSSFSATEMQQNMVDYWTRVLPGFPEFRAVSQESKHLICEWLMQLCDRNPEVEVIYRPHPSEHSNTVLKQLAGLIDNFHYIDDWPAIQWVKVCDRILSWISTSVADAHYAGKPIAVLRPAALSAHHELELLRGAALTTTYDDLERFVRAPYAGSPLAEGAFERFYRNAPQQPAYRLLADRLEELVRSDVPHAFPGVRYQDATREIPVSATERGLLQELLQLVASRDRETLVKVRRALAATSRPVSEAVLAGR
jgi:hypothetical protein